MIICNYCEKELRKAKITYYEQGKDLHFCSLHHTQEYWREGRYKDK